MTVEQSTANMQFEDFKIMQYIMFCKNSSLKTDFLVPCAKLHVAILTGNGDITEYCSKTFIDHSLI